jgi:hypothetical protein
MKRKRIRVGIDCAMIKVFLSPSSRSPHIYPAKLGVELYHSVISGSIRKRSSEISVSRVKNDEKRKTNRRKKREVGHTASTIWIPPLNHLYLLRFFLCHASNSFTTEATPRVFPAGVSTIQARGTFSSEKRPPLTPATVTSLINLSGWTRRQSSISTGDTWAPETLRVS